VSPPIPLAAFKAFYCYDNEGTKSKRRKRNGRKGKEREREGWRGKIRKEEREKGGITTGIRRSVYLRCRCSVTVENIGHKSAKIMILYNSEKGCSPWLCC